ncbi:NAD(P)/FAD-dependent oxidoreductase [Arenimonas terrae]|uniref:FAD-binding oxidoreductase n=1 Tax=Arenimonas terrae TaxID=2546226 RepID=A0A5C4RTA9_9GAMM|nr:FAD-dependent oxidoreductase [Arenimonas terrae]TNJ34416.1 FAD-binding oxidoreductase [Arenimonas terrae]
MDLKSGYPYWAVKNGLMHAFPRLEADAQADVAIIGGGITAALVADELCRHGHSVIVLEQRDVAWGSTAASTALLQYEIDTHLVDLTRKVGLPDAVLAYRSCVDAVRELGRLARAFPDAGFRRQDSLYLASRAGHVRGIRREFEARRRAGIEVEWQDRDALRSDFGLDAPAGLLTRPAATVDPYRLAYRLLMRVEKKGGQVHDRTRVLDITTSARRVELHTEGGPVVRAGRVIIAAGYASQAWLPKAVAKNRSSYAFISDPVGAERLGFLSRTLVWESARPYLYLRSTTDGRLLVGGEDDAVDIPARRDRRVEKKQAKLQRRLAGLFPDLELTPAFAWAGTFAETADGLPYFGPHPAHGPRVLFALAYGGNGITYSLLGAGLLRARIESQPHPLARLFSFERTAG